MQLLRGIKPEPFSIGSKTVVTDESVTRDEADQDESVQQELNLDLFSQRVRTLKTTASYFNFQEIIIIKRKRGLLEFVTLIQISNWI